MKVSFDIHWVTLGWVIGSIVSFITLALSLLLMISFIPEIEELLTKINKRINKESDKS
jgi:hypothetical protein